MTIFGKEFWQKFYEFIWYAFYFPYLLQILRIFPKFSAEMSERPEKKRNWKKIFWFGARILFWFFINEIIPHFFYFDAILERPEILRKLNLDLLAGTGYCAGQFFFMKYFVIFGAMALFAEIDGMAPPAPPICISRVALYSKMWRNFDRGLYDFFKFYIFFPISSPNFSIPKKFFGLTISFFFVLLWHGFQHQYCVWVAFNLKEIITENLAKGIFFTFFFKFYENQKKNQKIFRRILAFFQIYFVPWGLFGVFYFLGGSESGWVFVDRIWNGEAKSLSWSFFFLLFIGYCFTNMCMDVEKWEEKKKRKNEKIE